MPVISPPDSDNFSKFVCACVNASCIGLNSPVFLFFTTFNIFLSASSNVSFIVESPIYASDTIPVAVSIKFLSIAFSFTIFI